MAHPYTLLHLPVWLPLRNRNTLFRPIVALLPPCSLACHQIPRRIIAFALSLSLSLSPSVLVLSFAATPAASLSDVTFCGSKSGRRWADSGGGRGPGRLEAVFVKACICPVSCNVVRFVPACIFSRSIRNCYCLCGGLFSPQAPYRIHAITTQLPLYIATS